MHDLSSAIHEYLKNLAKAANAPGAAPELSLRPSLDKLLQDAIKGLQRSGRFNLVNEGTTAGVKGRPDFILYFHDSPNGYVEAESIDSNLKKLTGHAKVQNDHYCQNLDNFLLTNHLDFELWHQGSRVATASLPDPRLQFDANAAVDSARVPYQDKVADRAALVKSLGPLVTQSLAYVKSNTAWAKRYDAIKALADKVRGVRPPRPKVVDPAADKKTRNSGELSHAEIAAHMKRYIARLEALTGYAPPDAKISIAQLTAQLTTLTELNQSVPALAQTLTDAIADRQESYNGTNGLKACFDGVKVSVKGQYGQTSTQYKSISGMRW